jgi:C-terminal processing protease CtpA/Prc
MGVLEGNIGYIRVSQFGEDTASLMERAANELKDKKVKRVFTRSPR